MAAKKQTKTVQLNSEYKSLSVEQKKQNVIKSLDNPYTDKISRDEKKIYYTGEFYVRLTDLMENGMTPVEAYEACGYSVRELGEDRAYKAARQAKEFMKKDSRYDWRSYSGMETPDLDSTEDPRVIIAQLTARVKALETMDEVQKKILPEFMEQITALNQKEKK